MSRIMIAPPPKIGLSSQRTFTFGSMDSNCSRTSAIGLFNLCAFSCFFFVPAFKRFSSWSMLAESNRSCHETPWPCFPLH